MSKIQVVFSFLMIAALAFCSVVIKKQKDQLALQDRRISNLWFGKLTGHKYLVNTTYRDYPHAQVENVLDSLDGSLDILLKLSYHEALSSQDTEYLNDFVFSTLTNLLNVEDAHLLQNFKIECKSELFEGNDFEIVERLERVVNPYFMTKCKEYQIFDLYEKHEEWSFLKGDTVKLMVRLLPNYSLHSHVVELVSSKNMRLVNPYFGEIQYVAEEDAIQGSRHEIQYQTYDWISRDMVENTVVLAGGGN